MDLFLQELEEYVKRLSVQNQAEAALIIDKDGIVVAHSDYLEVGKDYNTERGEAGAKLVDALGRSYDGTLMVDGPNGRYAVFFDRCSKGWYIVLIINEKDAFRSLKIIYLMAGLALLVVLAIVFIIFNYMGYKQNEVEHLGREVLAVADIYITMLLIDIETDRVTVIRENKMIEDFLNGNFGDFSYRTEELAKRVASEQYVDMVTGFLDLDTLDDRMENGNTISIEYEDYKNRWIRVRYIVMKRDESGRITQALLAVESIDDDRKKQEHLRILSETDHMTGIMNRGSGEKKIREMLPTIEGGMFCLMDADKFKYVNDNYGHAVGDKVLIAIARALKESFRESDIVFRLGGDEFAAFAVGVKDRDVGMRIIERFFVRITLIDIPELEGHSISVSMGAAFYDANARESFEKLYERADKGTYNSKATDGNKVTFN